MPLPIKTISSAGYVARLVQFALLMLLACCVSSCVSVKTEHKIEPIHITMDVNVRLEKELDKAFEDLDRQAAQLAESQNK